MEKDKIGARLKEAIKKRGFKQEEFAEKCVISYPALKRYMSGKNVYTYEHLEKFADVLNCSYDYLLGKSDSFKQEYHEVTKMTHLSEKAIENIYKRAKYYDEEFEAKRYIMVLDLLLREEECFDSLCNYMLASKFVNYLNGIFFDKMQDAINNMEPVKKMGIQKAKRLSVESQQMIDLVTRFKEMKETLTPEFIEQLKDLDTEENFTKSMAKLMDTFKMLGGY